MTSYQERDELASMAISANQKMQSMHAHVNKCHKGHGHVKQGLGHPPQSVKVNKGPSSLKNAALSLSLSSLMKSSHLSLPFRPSPLSFANGQYPLSLACVQRAKLIFEVAC